VEGVLRVSMLRLQPEWRGELRDRRYWAMAWHTSASRSAITVMPVPSWGAGREEMAEDSRWYAASQSEEAVVASLRVVSTLTMETSAAASNTPSSSYVRVRQRCSGSGPHRESGSGCVNGSGWAT